MTVESGRALSPKDTITNKVSIPNNYLTVLRILLVALVSVFSRQRYVNLVSGYYYVIPVSIHTNVYGVENPREDLEK